MKLSNLANVLRSAGLTVVECAGWSNRGYAGQDLAAVRGVLWHHTATNRQRFYDSDAPTLSMCVNGRSDLAGPLCNIVFGRNGTVYLVAAGVANHAGAGSAHGIPANMGNHYLIGIEMESSGIAPWDWTADQLRVAPYLGAALERAYGVDLQIAHYEYSNQGKIDPAGWPGGMDGLRASINAKLDGQSFNLSSTGITTQSTKQEEEDMPLTEADHKAIAREIWGFKNPEHDARDMRQIVADIPKDVPVAVWSYANPSIGGGDAYQILRDAVANTDRIASAVASAAAQAASEGATVDQIKDAVKQAISESVVAVDVSVKGGK